LGAVAQMVGQASQNGFALTTTLVLRFHGNIDDLVEQPAMANHAPQPTVCPSFRTTRVLGSPAWVASALSALNPDSRQRRR